MMSEKADHFKPGLERWKVQPLDPATVSIVTDAVAPISDYKANVARLEVTYRQ
jgi:hypothetical protein